MRLKLNKLIILGLIMDLISLVIIYRFIIADLVSVKGEWPYLNSVPPELFYFLGGSSAVAAAWILSIATTAHDNHARASGSGRARGLSIPRFPLSLLGVIGSCLIGAEFELRWAGDSFPISLGAWNGLGFAALVASLIWLVRRTGARAADKASPSRLDVWKRAVLFPWAFGLTAIGAVPLEIILRHAVASFRDLQLARTVDLIVVIVCGALFMAGALAIGSLWLFRRARTRRSRRDAAL